MPVIGFAQSSEQARSLQASQNIIPTVIVTAPRLSADTIDTDFQTGRVTVISRDEFEGDVATVADVLRKETGIQIRQLGGLGSYSTVNIRGASGAQVNVFLDGVLLNGAYGGVVDLSQFPLGVVEQIEIYRGNVPIQLGQSSIGGAINIKTLQSKNKPEKRVEVGVGSFDTKKIVSSVNGRSGELSYQFSAEYLASDNDFKILNDNLTPEYKSDDRLERRNNADFEHFSGLLASEYRFNEMYSLQFVGQISNKIQGLSELQNHPLTRSKIETLVSSAQFKLNHWVNQDTTLAYKVFASQKDEFFDDLQGRIGLNINEEEGITQAYGVGFQLTRNMNAHLISLNIETKYETYTNNNLHLNESTKYERHHSTFGIQDEWLSSNGSWLATVGARALYFDEFIGQSGATSNDFHNSIHTGLRFSFNESYSISLNVSRDIRTPLLEEKFGDRGYTNGNEDLLPEKAINADIGFDFVSKGFNASASYFYRTLDNAIITIFDSQGVGQAENISKSQVSGLEIESTFSATPYWSVLFKSTLQDSKDMSNSSSAGGKLLPGLYEFEAFLSNTVTHENLKFSLEYQYQTGGFYDSSNTENSKLPNIKQVNFIAGWKLSKRSIQVSLENISNQRVQDFHRYPGPGRQLFLTYTQIF